MRAVTDNFWNQEQIQPDRINHSLITFTCTNQHLSSYFHEWWGWCCEYSCYTLILYHANGGCLRFIEIEQIYRRFFIFLSVYEFRLKTVMNRMTFNFILLKSSSIHHIKSPVLGCVDERILRKKAKKIHQTFIENDKKTNRVTNNKQNVSQIFLCILYYLGYILRHQASNVSYGCKCSFWKNLFTFCSAIVGFLFIFFAFVDLPIYSSCSFRITSSILLVCFTLFVPLANEMFYFMKSSFRHFYWI